MMSVHQRTHLIGTPKMSQTCGRDRRPIAFLRRAQRFLPLTDIATIVTVPYEYFRAPEPIPRAASNRTPTCHELGDRIDGAPRTVHRWLRPTVLELHSVRASAVLLVRRSAQTDAR